MIAAVLEWHSCRRYDHFSLVTVLLIDKVIQRFIFDISTCSVLFYLSLYIFSWNKKEGALKEKVDLIVKVWFFHKRSYL
jgi:hypothetical protein